MQQKSFAAVGSNFRVLAAPIFFFRNRHFFLEVLFCWKLSNLEANNPILAQIQFLPSNQYFKNNLHAPASHLHCTISLFLKDKGWYFFLKWYNFTHKCIPRLLHIARGKCNSCHCNIPFHQQLLFSYFRFPSEYRKGSASTWNLLICRKVLTNSE